MSQLAYVKISQIYLWESNPRTGFVQNENEEIFTLIEKQKTQKNNKLITLTQSLINDGFYENIGVLKYNDGFMVVKEGNRRITCLKLLKNPEIVAERYPEIYRAFKELKKIAKANLFNSIPALIFNEDENEKLEKWVELRHNGLQDGKGIDKWGAYEKLNWDNYRGRNTPLLSFHEYLVAEEILTKDEINSVSKTNWERILGIAGRAHLGIDLEDKKYIVKIPFADFKSRIIKTVSSLSGKSVGVVYDKELIEQFFRSLNFEEIESPIRDTEENQPLNSESDAFSKSAEFENSEPNNSYSEDTEINSKGNENDFEETKNDEESDKEQDDTSDNDTKKPYRQSKPSPFLSNLTCYLQSSQETDGIIRLSDELRRMSREKVYKSYPIAAAVLMRILLEQCLIYYLKKRNKWDKFFSTKRSDPTFKEIVEKYRSDSDIFAQDKKMERLFCILTETVGLKELFNMIVHHPDKVGTTPDALDIIAQSGYLALVQYIIDYK